MVAPRDRPRGSGMTLVLIAMITVYTVGVMVVTDAPYTETSVWPPASPGHIDALSEAGPRVLDRTPKVSTSVGTRQGDTTAGDDFNFT